jgi:hypothetical protein
LQGYSDCSLKHFNHTQLHRGICVRGTCNQYYEANPSGDLNETLEACLNDTIWRDYKLQVKIQNIRYCQRAGEKIEIDTSDVIVGIVYIIILALNAIGSAYDVFWQKKNEKAG